MKTENKPDKTDFSECALYDLIREPEDNEDKPIGLRIPVAIALLLCALVWWPK